jgi:hypothetical protein
LSRLGVKLVGGLVGELIAWFGDAFGDKLGAILRRACIGWGRDGYGRNRVRCCQGVLASSLPCGQPALAGRLRLPTALIDAEVRAGQFAGWREAVHPYLLWGYGLPLLFCLAA